MPAEYTDESKLRVSLVESAAASQPGLLTHSFRECARVHARARKCVRSCVRRVHARAGGRIHALTRTIFRPRCRKPSRYRALVRQVAYTIHLRLRVVTPRQGCARRIVGSSENESRPVVDLNVSIGHHVERKIHKDTTERRPRNGRKDDPIFPSDIRNEPFCRANMRERFTETTDEESRKPQSAVELPLGLETVGTRVFSNYVQVAL